MIDEIKKTAQGARILTEWLGDGGWTVPVFTAERRSFICSICPQNKPGNWWENVKSAIADKIKEHLEVKNQLALHVKEEGELGTCKVCGCNLPLLVWVPIEHVRKHTPPEQVKDYPVFCWKRQELEVEP